MKSPWIIGLGGSSHDFSAAISCGNDIHTAIEEERLTRCKHGKSWWFQNPVKNAVDYCLTDVGIDIDKIEAIVTSDLLPNLAQNAFVSKSVITYPHHLCHAASIIPILPYKARTTIIVIDGMGSCRHVEKRRELRETISFFWYEDGQLELRGESNGYSLEEVTDFPRGCTNSLGHLYELVTLLLGFGEFQEGKTMGLAAHGQPTYLELLRSEVTLGHSLDKCFVFNPYSNKLINKLHTILTKSAWSFSVKANLAASVQNLFEDVLHHCFSLTTSWNPDIIALAGGCGLNTVANGRLASSIGSAKQLVIPPYTGDSGLGIGAIWLYLKEQKLLNKPKIVTFRGRTAAPALARPGKIYSQDSIKKAACSYYPKIALDSSIASSSELATILANGKIVGVFNGASEIGPRALGGRSILADPRNPQIRERLNRKIKHREPFRPFAPMILLEAFDDYFENAETIDYYMLKVAKATEKCKKVAPAIVHIDGTARVQCVDRQTDPFLGALLIAFEKETSIPMLLNTSFNRRGEPIVETPSDAIDCFLGLELDGLYIDGNYYFKPG